MDQLGEHKLDESESISNPELKKELFSLKEDIKKLNHSPSEIDSKIPLLSEVLTAEADIINNVGYEGDWVGIGEPPRDWNLDRKPKVERVGNELFVGTFGNNGNINLINGQITFFGSGDNEVIFPQSISFNKGESLKSAENLEKIQGAMKIIDGINRIISYGGNIGEIIERGEGNQFEKSFKGRAQGGERRYGIGLKDENISNGIIELNFFDRQYQRAGFKKQESKERLEDYINKLFNKRYNLE